MEKMFNEEFINEIKISNDKIDIDSEPNITVTEMKTEFDNEYMIQLSGGSVDNSIVNSLRRTIMQYIPIYGYNRENIVINTSKSHHMYTNDMIYNQIETLPIFDIANDFDLENPNLYLANNKVMVKLFGHFTQQKMANTRKISVETIIDENKKILQIEFILNYKNETLKDYFVNTHHAVFKINNVVSKSYIKRTPIDILVLKPGEEIYLKATANLGMDILHASYEATTHAFHKKINNTTYHLWYETLGQIENKIILNKACQILVKKLEYLKSYINDLRNESDVTNKVEINIYGENHTLGHIITTALQKCKYVIMAGYCMPHVFTDHVKISYILEEKYEKKSIKILIKCIDYLIKVYILIREQVPI